MRSECDKIEEQRKSDERGPRREEGCEEMNGRKRQRDQEGHRSC